MQLQAARSGTLLEMKWFYLSLVVILNLAAHYFLMLTFYIAEKQIAYGKQS